MSILEHVEKHLGEINQGWKDSSSDSDLQIVLFEDIPGETVSTYLSLGLSNQALNISETKQVRQELVFSVYSMAISSMIVSVLLSLCEAIIVRGKAVLRGEVIPLSTEIANRIGFDAAYCTIPVLFEDEFCSYEGSSPSTVMVWILPIFRSEAEYIEASGWESFENLLEEKDPDLCSLERSSIV